MKDFEYIAFVDASGDDGFKFEDKNGSSPCFVVCALITEISNKDYNLKILDEVKKIGKIQDQNELKWSSFKKQKDNRFKALKKLCNLKSNLAFGVAFKKRIIDRAYINDPYKLLTSFIHGLCLETIFRLCLKADRNACIYIDQMKRVEQQNVKKLAKYTTNDNGELVETDHDEKVILSYVNSKAEKLIQAADFFSGALRSFFEKYDESWPWHLNCDVCNSPNFLCSYSRKKTPSQLKGLVGYWRAIYPIMSNDENGALDISTIPANLMKKMKFLQCAGQGRAIATEN